VLTYWANGSRVASLLARGHQAALGWAGQWNKESIAVRSFGCWSFDFTCS